MSAAAPGGLTVDSFFRQLLESFACQLIGFTIATTIYGITVLQTFIYFKRYPGDRRLLKITVVVLLILDTLGTMLVAHSLYTYLVLNYRDPAKDINLIWSFSLENGTTTLITFIVQCYFAQCLWRFSGKNKYLVGTIIFFAVSSFGLGVETTAHLFIVKTALSLSSKEVLVVGGLVQGLAALGDICITGGLCYYLQTGRSGIKTTDTLVDRLIIYSINRGALTTIVQILFLILNVSAPGHSYWVPFHVVVSKLYVNALLATLNVRRTLKNPTTEVELGQTSIRFKSVGRSRVEVQVDTETETMGQQTTNMFTSSSGTQLNDKPSSGTLKIVSF